MERNELKPCPFCGGEAKTSQGTTDPENKFEMGWIGCQECHCFISYINNPTGKRLATEAWNKRNRTIEADTVRKMQERLKAETITIQDHTGKLGSVILVSTIDQIAKELMGVD